MASHPATPHLGDSSPETPNYMFARRRSAQTDPQIQELVFYDAQNPRCVVNLLSEKLKANALKLAPHLLDCTTKELEQKFEPSMLDRQLRQAFWDEYFLTQDNSLPKMRMEAVYSKSCSREMFYKIVDNDIRYAWILKPPEEYTLKMKALLEIGLERLHEIIKLPIETERFHPKTNAVIKSINTKLIGEIIKAVAILDNRVRGAVPQHLRIQSEQKNLHLHANAGNMPYQEPKTHQEIQAELARIQREIGELNFPQEKAMIAGSDKIFHKEEDELITVTATRTET